MIAYITIILAQSLFLLARVSSRNQSPGRQCLSLRLKCNTRKSHVKKLQHAC